MTTPLLRAERLGSTGLASAMAYHVIGTPLPISAQRVGHRLRLSGRVFWASNMCGSGFVRITAVAGTDGAGPLIVALPGDAPGLMVKPHPALLVLQATGTSSLTLVDVPLKAEALVTDDFSGVIGRIRATFLRRQSSFCSGLAGGALRQGRGGLRGVNEVFASDLAKLAGEATRLAAASPRGACDQRRPLPVPEALQNPARRRPTGDRSGRAGGQDNGWARVCLHQSDGPAPARGCLPADSGPNRRTVAVGERTRYVGGSSGYV